MFESCSIYEGTVECQSSALNDSATYSNELLKLMTIQAQCIALSLLPKKLYEKRIGLRDIKVVRLRENYAQLIDKKYHDEMCPISPLEVWIWVKNYYPLGIKIERKINKDGIIWNAVVTPFDLEKTDICWSGRRRIKI